MKHFFMICLSLSLVVSTPAFAQSGGNVKDGNKIMQIATDWLKLIDRGEYAKAYDSTSPWFRRTQIRSLWVARIKGYREKLGPLQNRSSLSLVYKEIKNGMLLSTVHFSCLYEHQIGRRETVTLLYENGWKIIGYFSQ